MDDVKRERLRTVTEFVGSVIANPLDYSPAERQAGVAAAEELVRLVSDASDFASRFEGLFAAVQAARAPKPAATDATGLVVSGNG